MKIYQLAKFPYILVYFWDNISAILINDALGPFLKLLNRIVCPPMSQQSILVELSSFYEAKIILMNLVDYYNPKI